MSRTASPSSSRMNASGLQVAVFTSGRWHSGNASRCALTTPKGSMSSTRRPSSRRRRAAMHQSSPRGSMVTVEPSKPRRSGESRLSAISAPLPVRGGATVMAEPSRDQPISGAPGRAPHCPSRMPLRLASLRRKRRSNSRALPCRSDPARRLLSAPESRLRPCTVTSRKSMPSSAAAGGGTTSITSRMPSSAPSQAAAAPSDGACWSGRTAPAQSDAQATASAPP